MTWTLRGGPRHGEFGEGAVPDGYEFASEGRKLPMVYGLQVRAADEVYRWGEDVAYIRDGEAILKTFRAGGYAVRAEHADLANAIAPFGMEALAVGVGFLYDSPETEDAARARESIDHWRAAGLV